MKTIVIWLLLCGCVCADDMFGLVTEVRTETVVIEDMFGLEPTPARRPVATVTKKVAAITEQLAEQPRSIVKTVLRPVVRRGTGPWIDPDVGSWQVETLTNHLKGELESTQHRGSVPHDQLIGRSLRELKAIHANLHEGFAWHGGASSAITTQKTATIESRLEIAPRNSTCPGGVCPTTSARPRLFGRRR